MLRQAFPLRIDRHNYGAREVEKQRKEKGGEEYEDSVKKWDCDA